MDFHFHVFLEWMYVRRAAEESDLHEGETDRVTEAEHTLHMTEWHLDRSELSMITSDLILMRHLMLCIPSSSRAEVSAILHTSFQLTIFGIFYGEKTTLRATQPAAIKRQSNFLSMDYFAAAVA